MIIINFREQERKTTEKTITNLYHKKNITLFSLYNIHSKNMSSTILIKVG